MDNTSKTAVAVLVLLGLAAFATSAFASNSPVDDSGATSGDMSQANIDAFLALIRSAESADDYTALVGGGDFSDFSDHPANLGWSGIQTPNGKSTAAGAYQITQTTWNTAVQPALSLPDFSPASQDQAALWIIRVKRRALPQVQAGQFAQAIQLLRGEWEAFDKMMAGTYHITLAQAQQIYINNGGTVTA